MSLLNKIRKRRKAKKLTQNRSVDGVVSDSSIDSGEQCDGDSDANTTASQKYLPNERLPIQETLSTYAAGKGVDSQSASSIPSYATKIAHDFVISGRENRFWPRIAKTTMLVLASSCAFCMGKMVTLGITLSLVLACKLFAKYRIQRNEKLSQKELEVIPARLTIERNCMSQEIMFQNGVEAEEPRRRSFTVSENTEGEKDTEMSNCHTAGNADTLMSKRKQLKRLKCLKLHQSALPLDEVKEESSSSPSSPPTWFRNMGNPMETGSDIVDQLPEIRRSADFEAKPFLRRFGKVETHSAPSSPSRSSTEASRGFLVASDGSDTEKSIHGPPRIVNRKSKFRPVSPVGSEVSAVGREVCGTDASKMLVKQQSLEYHALRKGENRATGYPSPDSSAVGIGRKANSFTAALCKAKLKHQNRKALPPEEISASIPPTITAKDSAPFAGLDAIAVDTQKAAPALQGTNARGIINLLAKPSSRALSLNRSQGRQHKRFGNASITLDLIIITSGLLMGRIVAVAVLICYWYALSSLRGRLLL